MSHAFETYEFIYAGLNADQYLHSTRVHKIYADYEMGEVQEDALDQVTVPFEEVEEMIAHQDWIGGY